MKTKNYVIKITGTDHEHAKAKKRIDDLFMKLNQELVADMEKYTQTIETKCNWGNRLYGLENRKVLTNSTTK